MSRSKGQSFYYTAQPKGIFDRGRIAKANRPSALNWSAGVLPSRPEGNESYGDYIVSLYLSGLPLWIAATLLVVIPTAIAMCGPVYIRHRVGLERLTTNNEIAGFKFATVGVIYAVLLAFAVIVVWERFSEAEGAVLQEAGAAATLYHLSAGADPDAAATRAALSNYLKLAIEKDWPSMANEQASAEVTEALNALYSATIRKGANGSTQSPVLVAETFKQLDVLTQARRSRLHLAEGIVPGILWTVLFCGAF